MRGWRSLCTTSQGFLPGRAEVADSPEHTGRLVVAAPSQRGFVTFRRPYMQDVSVMLCLLPPKWAHQHK